MLVLRDCEAAIVESMRGCQQPVRQQFNFNPSLLGTGATRVSFRASFAMALLVVEAKNKPRIRRGLLYMAKT